MSTYMSPGVYIKEVESGSRPIEGVGTAIAAFVGFAAAGPANTPTLVTNWGQYQSTFGSFVPGAYMPLAVYNYFDNGGGAAFIVRVGANGASANGGATAVPAAITELMSATLDGVAAYSVRALETGPGSDNITVTVTHEPVEGDGPTERITIDITGPGESERYEGLSTRRGATNIATHVSERSKLVSISELATSLSGAEKLPANGTFELVTPPPSPPVPESITSDDLIGDPADRSALGGLEAIEQVTMVAVPDLMSLYRSGAIDLEGVKVVQTGLIGHCERMGRMAILDPPPGLNAQEILDWRVDYAGYDSKYATLYWPWIKAYDPGTGRIDFIPPSGSVAGLWGRTDDSRGVHKAPANDVLRGAVDVHLNITRAEHDLLNPKGINVIRSFPGRGIRVWGARTLSSDGDWKYINVRRLFNFIEASILNGTQWAVFEPNDLALWQRITRTIRGFLLNVWRDGALFGATADEAFYVKCDAETNPPELIALGQVTTEIGIAPVKPAEFVVFKIAQLASGGDAAE